MDELPNELLACIAERCDFTSLKTSRLLNNKWHAISTPLVFEHFYMGLFDHSLSKLECLASSSLAKHVKKLTFYCDVLPAYTRADWEREVDARFGHLYHYKNDVDAECQAYKDLVQEQQDWDHSQQGQKFQDCFLSLRNLTEWPIWRRLTERCLVGPDQWKKRNHAQPFILVDSLDSGVDARAALALLEAMGERVSRGLRPITKLQLQLVCKNFYFMRPLGHDGWAQPVPLCYSNAVKPKIRTAFANLTDLSLYVEAPFDWEHFGGILADFSEFLYVAKQLRSLRFWFEYLEDFSGNWPGGNRLYTDQIGFFSQNTVVWPKIEHLALKVNIPSCKLLPFLKLHASTLKSLELRHMFVQDVPLLLEGIPGALQLDHVYIQGLWHYGPGLPQEELDDETNVCFLSYSTDCDRVYETWMKRYLLRHTPRMPDLRDDPLVRIKTGHGMNLVDYEPIFEDRTTHLDYSSVASIDHESPDPTENIRRYLFLVLSSQALCLQCDSAFAGVSKGKLLTAVKQVRFLLRDLLWVGGYLRHDLFGGVVEEDEYR
ncbi:hypothetical protein M409DRAFT_50191 [Zasmidium cellare ATCC 36951]|uniref:F-box domain-containing protein n=1 Tax=Zasmidium cellare ATCC 36951 TaxID=1080233 RepID=A0A6A6D2U8_ZASCE|nr:uncharacterized protein M409DRAFT_50191 [Zasmidium cellare ATCC 36951]KAF2172502.1 hypothetical protein M409DRAFT_50191 [Zasmidium cellare ATCC 36951]